MNFMKMHTFYRKNNLLLQKTQIGILIKNSIFGTFKKKKPFAILHKSPLYFSQFLFCMDAWMIKMQACPLISLPSFSICMILCFI